MPSDSAWTDVRSMRPTLTGPPGGRVPRNGHLQREPVIASRKSGQVVLVNDIVTCARRVQNRRGHPRCLTVSGAATCTFRGTIPDPPANQQERSLTLGGGPHEMASVWVRAVELVSRGLAAGRMWNGDTSPSSRRSDRQFQCFAPRAGDANE